MRRKIADLPPMPPGYNITPGTFQPVVRLSEETGEREMSLMEWGLVPYWSKMHKMISNCARDDKLTISGAWIKLWFEELFVVAFEELFVVGCRGASALRHVRS
jgi:putative SOS response-associated peptidase YedK